jgi:hypothetical protein
MAKGQTTTTASNEQAAQEPSSAIPRVSTDSEVVSTATDSEVVSTATDSEVVSTGEEAGKSEPLPDSPSSPAGSNPALHDKQAPLPAESLPPPLPREPLPREPLPDDGWAPVWEPTAQAYYFYNSRTGATQWTNPRVSDGANPAPARGTGLVLGEAVGRRTAGYDPSIHGDYDPDAWYAQVEEPEPVVATQETLGTDATAGYAATGAFNRFTGRWQAADINPENHSDESKSRRQMSAYFDVDAMANNHDGRSLRAERAQKKWSKRELQEFKEKRKAKKEERRRAWLLD